MEFFSTDKLKLYFIILLFFVCKTSVGQNYTQDISGHIFDSFTGSGLPGAVIIAKKDTITKATVSDSSGFFILKNLPIGKYNITGSYIGYNKYSSSILLSSGKTANLEIGLKEDTYTIENVLINAYKNKAESNNKMALTGVRSFTLEETEKYAGSYGDPARMAMNYAGVLPVRDNRNDIIIRGNSAFGLQWRIEGVEIPNPNHFGASGTTGGPITIINTNLLSKSDFFYGAFPAEYGNAIAGIFDLKMRAGNTQKHEKWLQLGWNGLELGLEGPLSRKNNYSYLVSIRHSVTDIAYSLGADTKNEIHYQDISFKLNFPGTKTGNWSFTGMGGNSQIIIDEQKYDINERPFKTYGNITDNYCSMGVLALTNKIYPDNKTKITTILSITENEVKNKIDTFSLAEETPFLWASENSQTISLSGKTRLNYKINKTLNFSAGISYNNFLMSFHDMQYITGEYINYTDTAHANTGIAEAYIEMSKNFGSNFTAYLGFHEQYFFLNGANSSEPRFSLKYKINANSDISYGFGLHSQLIPKVMYFVQTKTPDNSVYFSNKNLDFIKSIHNVISYNLFFNKDFRFKTEIYYQYLYDVPVHERQAEYSLINFGTEYYVERKDSLINAGTGLNYGIEFTFEQFLKNNFFYLFTLSLFESKYKSTDNIVRNTAYNGEYAANILGGYELNFSKKHVGFIFGINFTYAGGSPYVPFDSEETVKQGRIVYDWSNAYKVKRPDYKRVSLRLGIKRNFKKTSLETSFDLQYRTDYTTIYRERIDITTGEIINCEKLGFYPMVYTRFNF